MNGTREWKVGYNGNHFCDMGGFRYCVAYVSLNNYEVVRNGEVINTKIPSVAAAQMIASSDARVHETYGTNQ